MNFTIMHIKTIFRHYTQGSKQEYNLSFAKNFTYLFCMLDSLGEDEVDGQIMYLFGVGKSKHWCPAYVAGKSQSTPGVGRYVVNKSKH